MSILKKSHCNFVKKNSLEISKSSQNPSFQFGQVQRKGQIKAEKTFLPIGKLFFISPPRKVLFLMVLFLGKKLKWTGTLVNFRYYLLDSHMNFPKPPENMSCCWPNLFDIESKGFVYRKRSILRTFLIGHYPPMWPNHKMDK